jgi:hypothetical protein
MTDNLVITDDETLAPGKDDAPEVQQPAAKPEAPPEAKEDKVAKGTQFVDFSQIPDKDLATAIEKRFERMYANVKNLERKTQMSERDRHALFEANRRLVEEIENIKSAQTQRVAQDEISVIKAEINSALMAADYAKATDLTERLAELKASKREDKPIPVAQPAAQEPIDLTPVEQRQIVAWQQAVDDDGQPVRPWAHPGHPKFQKMQALIAAATKDPDMEGAPLSDILSHVDGLMSGTGKARQASAAVLSPTGEVPKQARAIALSDTEKRVAEKMFLNTRVAKTAEDAHNLFRRNKSSTSNRYVVED